MRPVGTPAEGDRLGQLASALRSEVLFEEECASAFLRFDASGKGLLDLAEVSALVSDLCRPLGLAAPSEAKLEKSVRACSRAGGGELRRDEFGRFYRKLLAGVVARTASGLEAAPAGGGGKARPAVRAHMMDGSECGADLSDAADVGEVRRRIAAACHVDEARVRLACGGRALENGAVVGELDAVISVVILQAEEPRVARLECSRLAASPAPPAGRFQAVLPCRCGWERADPTGTARHGQCGACLKEVLLQVHRGSRGCDADEALIPGGRGMAEGQAGPGMLELCWCCRETVSARTSVERSLSHTGRSSLDMRAEPLEDAVIDAVVRDPTTHATPGRVLVARSNLLEITTAASESLGLQDPGIDVGASTLRAIEVAFTTAVDEGPIAERPLHGVRFTVTSFGAKPGRPWGPGEVRQLVLRGIKQAILRKPMLQLCRVRLSAGSCDD